jgi:nitroimidazol reductase NimA-like FMN-containing flavoprotein (pyridoxamine 5'-phosphate oxidase superfamily)
MHETPEDLRQLQRVLDESYAQAGEHLRSIFTPERRMSAEDVARSLHGVFVLNLATVTVKGEPLVAPIDGLFYRGHVWFGVPPGAVRERHLRARPQVSATHTRGEDLCVVVHGLAREVDESEARQLGYLGYVREVYGAVWDYWDELYRKRELGSGFTAWIEPRRMYAALMRPEAIND